MNVKPTDEKTYSYRKRFGKFGIDARSLRWKSKEAAEVRYKELTSDINFEGKNILDVGCGFADVIPFILKKAKNIKYTGVDLVPEFIKVCKEKYKIYRFINSDYFAKPLLEKFDIILASGSLNSNTPYAVNFRKKAIKTMFDHANETIAFNMSGGHPQPKNEKGKGVYYADSMDILNYCFAFTSRIIFRHHYRKNDFTIVMFR